MDNLNYSYTDPLDNIFDSFDNNPKLKALDETSYQERANSIIFKLEVLDVDRYVKQNELKEITNPTFFANNGEPTSDGLLSYEIFGITKAERSGTFAYIDLVEYFIDPSCYKTLCRLEPSKIPPLIAGIKNFKISKEGELIEDPSGGTGIKWLRENFSKIKFRKSESRSRDIRIKYIYHNYKMGRLFINKYIVIPAFYRDINTSGKHTGVGQINTFYVNLISSAKALRDNNNYGMSIADTTCSRMQNTIKAIYDWFCGNTNSSIKDKGTGLGGKFGIIRSNMNYTSDYSSRLVLSAPELKANSIDDLMVTLDKSAVPLAAITADFYPFMLFHIRKFFENEFLNNTDYQILNKQGKIERAELDSPMLYFTDEMIKKNMKNFVYSHDTRFIPIKIPIKNSKEDKYMVFKGKPWDIINNKENTKEPALSRPLTWVDVIYIAAVKSIEGKRISFTRYPYDSYFNTIYTGVEISSTKETEPIIIDGELYKWYPKIRLEDIGKPSAIKFIDTMQISNLYLNGMGGDYDGDMGQVKGSFFKETNDELKHFTNSKANFITLGCKNNRVSEKEAIQSMYNMTLILREDKNRLSDPRF